MSHVRVVVAAERVVAELVLQGRAEGHRVGLVFGHGGREEGTVVVSVHGFHTGDPGLHLVAVRTRRPGEPADVVEILHARAVRPALQEADGEHPTREDQVAEVVEVVEERGDGLHRRVTVDRQHLGRVARV